MNVCPHCGSREAKKVVYIGAECIVCPKCGYSECDELDIVGEQRVSQKAKGQHSPYKAGGARRSVKK